MPPIAALLHTHNDELRLGRALETLLPCSEIVIVDHHSTDGTCRIAQRYGARVVRNDSFSPHNLVKLSRPEWIFCLQARESITEGLQASLYEFTLKPVEEGSCFSILIREETGSGWTSPATPETRLIPRNWKNWNGRMPRQEPSAATLQGHILRFRSP